MKKLMVTAAAIAMTAAMGGTAFAAGSPAAGTKCSQAALSACVRQQCRRNSSHARAAGRCLSAGARGSKFCCSCKKQKVHNCSGRHARIHR